MMANAILSTTWQALGPFPIGTREQDFGADILEAYGGFRNLNFNTDDSYPSELAIGGYVSWLEVESVNGRIGPINYPNINWMANDVPFGWSIEQFQSWARGSLRLEHPTTLLFQVSGATEFYVNDKRYSGDVYSYHTTSHAIHLDAGVHTVTIRMVHDVRAFGGGKSFPQAQFSVTMSEPDEKAVKKGALIVQHDSDNAGDILLPSFLTHRGFAGKYGSVSVQNIGVYDVKVNHIEVKVFDESTNQEYEAVATMTSESITIVAGQIRPISFSFELPEMGFLQKTRLGVQIIVNVSERNTSYTLNAFKSVKCIDWREKAFQYTFLDFDGTVQYAMARRPKVLDSDVNKPIILAVHGAGVEANTEFWTDSIQQQHSVWIIFPTGRTSWGYDWHGPSTQNAFQSVQSIVDLKEMLSAMYICNETDDKWVKISRATTLRSCEINDGEDWAVGDTNSLIYVGHSNGGQGAWYLGTHFPDRAIAAVPAAGYLKIQDYVSYANWVGQSHADPLLRGVLECAIAEYNNDLHISNMAGLAVLSRVGSDDDNVPPIHTRKYNRLLNENAKNTHAFMLSEVPGQGHWWNQVLSGTPVQEFLERQIQHHRKNEQWKDFHITVMNPAGTGSVRGIQVEQLSVPYRLGKLFVSKENAGNTSVSVQTTNIAAFTVTTHFNAFKELIIDGDTFPRYIKGKNDVFFVKDATTNKWKAADNSHWRSTSMERTRLLYGPIHRMYESTEPLVIVMPSIPKKEDDFRHAALQISHDWYLYGRGDTAIFKDTDKEYLRKLSHNGIYYRVYLGLPSENQALSRLMSSKPGDIVLSDNCINVGTRKFTQPGTGILFLWKGFHENEIVIVVSGLDADGFDSAWRILPKRTGMMVPEWIVVGPESRQKGLGGVLGAGSFHFSKKEGEKLPPVFQEQADEIRNFFKDCHALACKVMMCLAIGLEIPSSKGGERWLSDRHAYEFESGDILRLLHYPPCPELDDTDNIRIASHSDYGSVTLLFQNGVGGLEIQKSRGAESEWLEAPVMDGCVVVNLGDCLEYWTNGLLRSTKHRVIFKPETREQERYSMAFFCQGGDIPLEPIPSPFISNERSGEEIITAAKHLEIRLRETRRDPY
ncbi:hypothetical protein DFQ30_011370 [Apophysomyces sp. BC1015]|nr:hypothetical protein DFQ30_011370 [Apophysomyces sp. BC1015]